MNDTTMQERSIAHAVPRDLVIMPGFQSAQGFELLQREARAFTNSSMVPATFRQWNLDSKSGELNENKEALSNAMIALNMALRMRADPLMVMQNLYIVHGYPAWSAKFLIGLFNTCGRFSTIRYRFNEARDACFAFCRELSSGDMIEGPSCSIVMAKAEGWMDRRGSKWRTMPEVMLTNRAAAFLIRTSAPELSLGLPMRDEAEDVVDVEARDVSTQPSPLQAVRDLLRADAPPAPISDALPPDVDYPLGQQPPPAVEPELPLKDGELTPQDRTRIAPAKPKPEKPAEVAPDEPPAFNVDVYARRIRAVADLDLLTLMREEIASLPPSMERDDLMGMIDSRTRELIGPAFDEES